MGDIKIGRIPLGSMGTNCYFVYRDDVKDAIVFDPGDSGAALYDKLKDNGINVKAIFLTHGHFDHVYGVKELKEKSDAKVYACKDELELLRDPELNVSAMMGRLVTVEPDELFADGDTYDLCDMTFQVIATPGHTAGGACFYFKEAGILIAGDTLFEGSVGRTDFPTGSMKTLVDSINKKLMELPDNTRVYPGHGGTTTIGDERQNNPFI
ncbi:MAG: MBL fold metallo-hydrolase [Lachnospiraceae bacterium]|nr:MBL fold metallo-hydrolase [Lachnospiraceae bacterium]MBR5761698.1 MBL fold metallo-hydrolase [Lachnospiraceae bacterium]